MTLYFNAASDSDWNTLANWWEDSLHTVAASALPTNLDVAQIDVACTANGGSQAVCYDLILFAAITIDVDCFHNCTVSTAGEISGSGNVTCVDADIQSDSTIVSGVLTSTGVCDIAAGPTISNTIYAGTLNLYGANGGNITCSVIANILGGSTNSGTISGPFALFGANSGTINGAGSIGDSGTNTGSINGNVTINNYGENSSGGTITGSVTIDAGGISHIGATIVGTVIINGTNSGTIIGDASIPSTGLNSGIISGTLTAVGVRNSNGTIGTTAAALGDYGTLNLTGIPRQVLGGFTF